MHKWWNGIHAGFRCRCPLRACEFESRLVHHNGSEQFVPRGEAAEEPAVSYLPASRIHGLYTVVCSGRTRLLGVKIVVYQLEIAQRIRKEVPELPCIRHRRPAAFPKSRILKKWFRYFNNKDFCNSGIVHLFSLMALYSYACFRSN